MIIYKSLRTEATAVLSTFQYTLYTDIGSVESCIYETCYISCKVYIIVAAVHFVHIILVDHQNSLKKNN